MAATYFATSRKQFFDFTFVPPFAPSDFRQLDAFTRILYSVLWFSFVISSSFHIHFSYMPLPLLHSITFVVLACVFPRAYNFRVPRSPEKLSADSFFWIPRVSSISSSLSPSFWTFHHFPPLSKSFFFLFCIRVVYIVELPYHSTPRPTTQLPSSTLFFGIAGKDTSEKPQLSHTFPSKTNIPLIPHLFLFLIW